MADVRSIIKIKGSEEMSLVQLFVPIEVAHDAVAELGERGKVQFIDVSQRAIYVPLAVANHPYTLFIACS